MLRVDRKDNLLKPMQNRSLAEAGDLERDGLQQLICRSPELFFAELGEDLFLVGQEIYPAELVDDRIDVLAIDRQGAVVVIELKRGSNRFQLLQGVSYAAMLSDWSPEDIIESVGIKRSIAPEQAHDLIEEFLEVDLSALNRSQRVILIAEHFDLEVLATAKWLSQKDDFDLIRCYRLQLSVDGQSDVLSCVRVFPLAQLEEQARARRHRSASGTSPADWDAAMAGMTNSAIREFIRAEVTAGEQGNLNKRQISYRIDGKRRFFVGARQDRAYVWQSGRFTGDIQFWRQRLESQGEIAPVKDDDSLRFYLSTSQDCARFKQAIGHELSGGMFVNSAEELVANQIPENVPPSA